MADRGIKQMYDKVEPEIVTVRGFSPIICADIKQRKNNHVI